MAAQCIDALITKKTLVEYFHDCVDGALSNQHVEAEPETAHYLVNLLSFFGRSENLYEHTTDGLQLKPLALIYADALNEQIPGARQKMLRRLGDVSLFISGVFSQSLNRKVVDLDYYIAMGGGAYGYLSCHMHGTVLDALGEVFAELASKFGDFVDVLAEVSERAELRNHTDVMRVYETWVRTGSRRSARLLQKMGIQPSETCTSRKHH